MLPNFFGPFFAPPLSPIPTVSRLRDNRLLTSLLNPSGNPAGDLCSRWLGFCSRLFREAPLAGENWYRIFPLCSFRSLVKSRVDALECPGYRVYTSIQRSQTGPGDKSEHFFEAMAEK